jgi:hypothetical protein
LTCQWPPVTVLAGIDAQDSYRTLALATVLGIYDLLAVVAVLRAAWQVRTARVIVPTAETGLP